MMTREEAIAYFEAWLKNYYEDEEVPPKLTPRVAKEALTALRPVSRERVEKMAAEWVEDINRGPAIFYCSSCGESFEIHSYEFQKYRFCPFCMAPMTDEAEDLMLKRLEALKDGEDRSI